MTRVVTPTFPDWDDNSSVTEIIDNGDSISIVNRFSTKDRSVELEVGVRLRPGDLDAFEREIRRIRQLRDI
jgi:hypothetical protein